MLHGELSVPLQERTFRDPQGRLFQDGNRILREIYPEHAHEVLAWIRSPLAQRWMEQGRLVVTEILESVADQRALLEHKRIFFPSFPWEWTPGQWKSAASLTLDLCEESLESGLILKDATPLNILFSGPEPVFVDALSFEKRDPENPLWIAYAQFVRMFLLPLAAHVQVGWPLTTIMHRRDGLEPADLAPWLTFFERWSSPFRSIVTLPMMFEKRAAQHNLRTHYTRMSPDIATPTLRHTLRKARKALDALVPTQRASRWSQYSQIATHYADKDHATKQAFVRRILSNTRPAHVLDVGANTGVYSRIAAECGAEVIAWDTDLRAADLNWQTALRERLPILPLVADFARPTPAVGWRNNEYASLLARSAGRFDCVLMLGILHHLLVADQIPLESVLEQLAAISTRWAVLEWIPKEDVQFLGLSRGREELYTSLNESYFLQTLSKNFAIRARETLQNGRILFHAEKLA